MFKLIPLLRLLGRLCQRRLRYAVMRCSALQTLRRGYATLSPATVEAVEAVQGGRAPFLLDPTQSRFAAVYNSAVQSGSIQGDRAQLAAARLLSRVCADVTSYLFSPQPSLWLPSIFRGTRHPQAPRGAYIWGGVGCGKTMLVDMMYEEVEPVALKRRDHFHKFTLDVHARNAADKLGNVARELASEFQLLVVDEFQITDISEAVIVHQLFRKLFLNGVVLIATSNRAPDSLYENGIQRELFTPLIPILHERCHVHQMGTTVDYRLRHSEEQSSTYFLGQNDGGKQFSNMFELFTGGFPVGKAKLNVRGRSLMLSKAAPSKRIAYFTFEELCGDPLSPADYRALCHSYHTCFLSELPKLDVLIDRNEMRRLTNFVDAAYEARVKLVVLAEAQPNRLFHANGAFPGDVAWPKTEEAFASERTVSRLIEMQSTEYLQEPWNPQDE
jgi:cell division protein ZapE